MSLKKHVELMQARAKSQLSALKEKNNDVQEFPCSLCEGGGYLLCTVNFSSVVTPTKKIQTTQGQPVVGIELMPCPTCSGTGIDRDEFLKTTSGEAA